ncbi:MAG: halocyanin domain-containing protein [Haloarculaceae archaeon]
MKRRELLRTAGGGAAAGAAAVTAGSGAAAAAEGGGEGGGGKTTKPKFSYLQGVDGGYKDLRGKKEVTVEVGASGNGGNVAFKPAGIWIDPGTTVKWKWTGKGGQHNVQAANGPASLGSEKYGEAGVHYEHTFTKDETGITNYFCAPHKALGMKGAVAVGEGVETITVGGSTAWPTTIEGFAHNVGVPIQKHYVGIVSFLGIAVSLVFTFYVLKYGESPNTGRGGV